MNGLIEILNGTGERLISIGWPILWQSSLLITVIFCLDYLLAKKIRAAVRYALWLAVLVKLLLPPTLALPTGAAWWLTPAKPTAPPQQVVRHFTVTYGETLPSPDFELVGAPLPPPAPQLELAGWLLLTAAFISAVLLLWMMVRWWQVTRMVQRAKPWDDGLNILNSARTLAKRPTAVRLKTVEGRMSPAVCGLFRPVILLPHELAEKFSPEQLRAVLLHELFHLRRGDVWVNCAQALLQIIYWWHPLLWLANGRIRRLREEAVDDAVMLTLRDEADSYAPTLLEVAKLAFRRPLLSLGLVGIMESRSALRQRIERLVDFRAPRRAGLTLASLCGVFVFSAVALPMGEAPSLPDTQATPISATSASATHTNAPAVLIQAEIYRMQQTEFEKLISDPAFKATKADEFKNFKEFKRLLKVSDLQAVMRPRIQTTSGLPGQFFVGNETNSIELECRPVVTNGLIDLTTRISMTSTVKAVTTTNQITQHTRYENGGGHVFSMRSQEEPGGSNLVVVTIRTEIVTNQTHFQQRLQTVIQRANQTQTNVIVTTGGRKAIISKLDKIRLDHVSYDHLPLSEVIRQLAEQSKQNDPESKGINFIFKPNEEQSGAPKSVVNPLTGQAVPDNTNSRLADIRITIAAMTNATLGNVLDAVVMGASQPTRYSILDYGVMFSAYDRAAPLFYTRSFQTDTNIFPGNLMREAMAFGLAIPKNSTNFISLALRTVFTNIGVNLESPPGKAVYYNYGQGVVFVRATVKDLDFIEKVMQTLNHAPPQIASPPPQIHIKARFVEVPIGTISGLSQKQNVTNFLSAGALTGILDAKNYKAIIDALEPRKDVKILAEPEVVTTSGRQVQMRATYVQNVITNIVFEGNPSNSAVNFITGNVQSGPIFDAVPTVYADGYTVNLRMTASRTKFWGYAQVPSNTVPQTVTNSAGEPVTLPIIWPCVELSRAKADVNLYDNQTAMLTLDHSEQVVFGEPDTKREQVVADWIRAGKKKNHEDGKETLVFVTATIVDPAGNRVHSDGDLSFTQNMVPPQPK